MTAERKVLPETFRLARNLKEGMEVKDEDGNWFAITSILRIYKPLNVVSVTYSDGLVNSLPPTAEVMSR